MLRGGCGCHITTIRSATALLAAGCSLAWRVWPLPGLLERGYADTYELIAPSSWSPPAATVGGTEEGGGAPWRREQLADADLLYLRICVACLLVMCCLQVLATAQLWWECASMLRRALSVPSSTRMKKDD
jgi:hypothetical protein